MELRHKFHEGQAQNPMGENSKGTISDDRGRGWRSVKASVGRMTVGRRGLARQGGWHG